MIASEIELYEVLKTRIGDKEAAAFVEILDKKSTIVSEIDAKIAETRTELVQMIADTRAELVNRIADTRALITDTKADLIKWMFIFWVGQVAVTFGFILLFLKK